MAEQEEAGGGGGMREGEEVAVQPNGRRGVKGSADEGEKGGEGKGGHGRSPLAASPGGRERTREGKGKKGVTRGSRRVSFFMHWAEGC